MSQSLVTGLKARRDAIVAKIASADANADADSPVGFKPDGDGAQLNHVQYKESLYRELNEIDALIARYEGPTEHVSYGRV